jgi:hypothetical protein
MVALDGWFLIVPSHAEPFGQHCGASDRSVLANSIKAAGRRDAKMKRGRSTLSRY